TLCFPVTFVIRIPPAVLLRPLLLLLYLIPTSPTTKSYKSTTTPATRRGHHHASKHGWAAATCSKLAGMMENLLVLLCLFVSGSYFYHAVRPGPFEPRGFGGVSSYARGRRELRSKRRLGSSQDTTTRLRCEHFF
ncbi:hypothetical protein MAPG_08653, partial [Magnaporthiopsis poae ATCC 64411]